MAPKSPNHPAMKTAPNTKGSLSNKYLTNVEYEDIKSKANSELIAQ